MANTKQYSIKINGLTESINAVDSLNKQLDKLEQRMKTLSSAKVSTGGGSSKGSSALSEEERVQREINKLKEQGKQLDAKIAATQDEIYKRVDATKQLYKETLADQKAIAAQERLTANAYSNTMVGMKQQLADLKAVIQTVDLGDGDQIKKMTEQANELTNKLKEMEEAYGQFGRNVGNYKSALDGIDKLKIEVGGVTREFGSAREASKTLKNELYALEASEKGNTKQAENLRSAIYRLKSIMDDATKSSRAMDEAMDFMQSFTAMASVGNGLQAFFGFDDNEITKSIQKLVALQGVLNGLETIRKQMETREGIGKILGGSFEKIDTWTYGLRRMNVQLRGTGTSARIAAAGIKVLNFALKGLTTLGIGVAIDLLVEGLQKAATAIRDFARGDADLITSAEVVQNAINAQNMVLEKNLDLIKKRHDAGEITSEQARIQTEKEYAKQLDETSKSLMKIVEALQLLGALSGDIGLKNVLGDKGVTWIGGFSEGIKDIDGFIKRFDDLEQRVAHGSALKSWFSSASDARDEFVHLTQLIAGDFMVALRKFNDGTEEGTRKLIAYIEQMDKLTDGRYSRAMSIVKFDNEGLQRDVDNAWAMIQNLRDKVFKNPIVVKLELDAKIEQELDRLDPTRAAQRTVDEWKTLLKKGVDEAGNVLTEGQKKNIKKIISEQEKNIAKQRQQRLDTERNNAKKLAQEQERVEKELNKLRIENMQEGLQKTLAQLKEERRERLEQARITGIKVGELTLEINKLYDKKELDAKREHAMEVQQVYKDMWESIYRIYDQNFRMNLDSELTDLENKLRQAKEEASQILNPRYMTYGGTQLPPGLSDERKRELGYGQYAKMSAIGENVISSAKKYLDLLEKIELAEQELGNWDEYELPTEELNAQLEEAKKELSDWASELGMTEDEFKKMMNDTLAVQELIQEGYTKSLKNAFKARIGESKKYYDEMLRLENDFVEKKKENDLKLLGNESNSAQRDENNRYEEAMARLEESRKRGLMSQKNYNELSERMAEEHANTIEAILTRQATEEERIIGEAADKIKDNNAKIANFILNEYEDAYAAASKMASRQPQLMSGALGDLGIIDYGKARKQLKEVREMLNSLSREIVAKRNELLASALTEEDRQSIKRRFQGILDDIAGISEEVDNKQKALLGEFTQSINRKVQLLGSALGSMLQAFSDYADQQYENEINRLEEEIDKQKEIYSKQEALAQQHKDKINDIEDELATARGDRRMKLIEELNYEMEAQRKALQEKKKAEKEEKLLQKKKDKEEQDRKNAQKKAAVTQAIINGATAFMNALAQQPIWLGIALAAMTAAMTAAQIATINSAKYADGGIIQGRSHAQGGVKVLGGQAEVEGGEFITNKATTARNVELLEFINSKRKKVDLSDMIDFYASGKITKNVSPAKRVFADGGTLPSLRNDVDVNDRLLAAFEAYSERDVVVSVVDINNRQAAVKNVQVLAGVEND